MADNLRVIRKRIVGVRNTKQLTRAMKMVAAAKLRRAQDRVEGSRPYMKLIREMIATVSASTDIAGGLSPLQGPGKACLVLSSDRGLCGSYNNNVIKAALQYRIEHPEVKFILFGKKVIDAFRRRGIQTYRSYPTLFAQFSWETCAPIIAEIIKSCAADNVGQLDAIYTRFVSAGVQRLTHSTLFPFKLEETAKKSSTDILIEPDAATVLNALVEQYARFSFYYVACEVIASEHGARMTAMDTASKNAQEMIDKLTLQRNRARQATITKELLEIIGGKEALEG